VEVELVHALLDGQPVEAAELVERVQRIVRQRQRLLYPLDKAVPSAPGDRVTLFERCRAPLAVDIPTRSLSVISQRHGQSGTRELRESVRLMPVNPRSAILDLASVPGRRPGAASEP